MADQFEIDQIAVLETIITAYNAAIIALTTGGIESYTMDTGQSRQTVTKQNLNKMRADRQSLMNERSTLKIRCYGGGSITMRPGW